MVKPVMKYAAVIRHKDNQKNVAVQEYFETSKDARAWIAKQTTHPSFKWEVMVYE
jgi:hypothetical protein